MMKKNSVAVGIAIIVLAMCVLALVFITGPVFRGKTVVPPIKVPTPSSEPVTDPATGWTTYRKPNCGISYAIPPGWESQGWAAESFLIDLSSPADMSRDASETKISEGEAAPSISFYVNCDDDVASSFVTKDGTLIGDENALEAALAKGQLKNLGGARYLRTMEVAGRKAFLFELGDANSRPGEHYDSIFMHVQDRWLEIRASMTRFADIDQDQRGILDSIRILESK